MTVGAPSFEHKDDGSIRVTVQTPEGTRTALELRSSEATALAEMNLLKVDLERVAVAQSWLLAIIDQKDMGSMPHDNRDPLFAILFEGAVIAYCRCYEKQAKQGHQLDATKVYLGKPKGMKAHQQVWDLRNKHVAHDVNGFRDAAVAVAFYGEGWSLVEPQFWMRPDRSVIRNLGRLVRDSLVFVEGLAGELRGIIGLQIASMDSSEREELKPLAIHPPDMNAISEMRRTKR